MKPLAAARIVLVGCLIVGLVLCVEELALNFLGLAGPSTGQGNPDRFLLSYGLATILLMLLGMAAVLLSAEPSTDNWPLYLVAFVNWAILFVAAQASFGGYDGLHYVIIWASIPAGAIFGGVMGRRPHLDHNRALARSLLVLTVVDALVLASLGRATAYTWDFIVAGVFGLPGVISFLAVWAFARFVKLHVAIVIAFGFIAVVVIFVVSFPMLFFSPWYF